jgi:hypothetical protein
VVCLQQKVTWVPVLRAMYSSQDGLPATTCRSSAPVRLHQLLQLGELCVADGIPLEDAADCITLFQVYVARCAE